MVLGPVALQVGQTEPRTETGEVSWIKTLDSSLGLYGKGSC